MSCDHMRRCYGFTVEPLVTFSGAGGYKLAVCKALERWNVCGGWYEMTLDEACRVICRTLRRQPPVFQVPLGRGLDGDTLRF